MVYRWLRRVSLATLLASFMSGPSLFGVGPISLNLFDLLFACLIFIFFIILTFGVNVKVSLNGPSLVGMLYPCLVVLFSIFGGVIYGYPLGYIVGDIRWVQALFVCYALFYSYGFDRSLINDFRWVVIVGIAVNCIFVLMQLATAASGGAPYLLEWWYKDVPSYTQRPLGFHINRFSGAVGQPSGLGFFSAMSVGYALVAMKGSKQIFVLSGASILLLASGSRTALVGCLVVAVGYILFLAGHYRARILLYACISLLFILPITIYFDLGRVVSSERYQALIEIAAGEISYHEAANRGERWGGAVSMRNNDYILLGTLSNPSHVYSDLIVDSGYLHVFARLGPIGLLFLSFTLLSPAISMMFGHRGDNVLLSCVVFVVIGVMAINSNAFTNIYVKSVLVFGVFLLSVRHQGRYIA